MGALIVLTLLALPLMVILECAGRSGPRRRR